MLKSVMFRQFFQNNSAAQQSPELSKVKAYRRITIRSVYLKQYQMDKAGQTVTCKDCGSENIKEWGLLKRDDHKRVHSCNDCGQILFRTIDRLPQAEKSTNQSLEQSNNLNLASC
ncbi:hypothetical protein [Catenovulum agarivorans]|uniref:hypothetical protein n=1 Tax=Catenovulum agarivorans TaxID=1172192 RepID=UPI000305F785|nr:hypothetical protein [Catenovulum agarivorans]